MDGSRPANIALSASVALSWPSYLSLPAFVSVHLCLSPCHCLSVSVCLALSVSVCLLHCLSPSVCLPLLLPLSISLCLSASVAPSVYLPLRRRLRPGHLSVRVEDSSLRCEEIVKISNFSFQCDYKYHYSPFARTILYWCIIMEYQLIDSVTDHPIDILIPSQHFLGIARILGEADKGTVTQRKCFLLRLIDWPISDCYRVWR